MEKKRLALKKLLEAVEKEIIRKPDRKALDTGNAVKEKGKDVGVAVRQSYRRHRHVPQHGNHQRIHDLQGGRQDAGQGNGQHQPKHPAMIVPVAAQIPQRGQQACHV